MRRVIIVALFVGTSCKTTGAEPREPVTTTSVAVPHTMGMARIPSADSRMGTRFGAPDEQPRHDVHVAAFEIDLVPVTVADYEKCVRAGACASAPTTTSDAHDRDAECNGDRKDRRDHPQNCIDWNMASTYCGWAQKRLPTEQEWEYAACKGDCAQSVGQRGGVAAIFALGHFPVTSPVRSGNPGAFGLYDMGGNVWEWTGSTYCGRYDSPPCNDGKHVARGGSWPIEEFEHVRFTARSPLSPEARDTNLGFRCARSQD
jgi:formylglycine-generating enzyme required for sulfatase activity